MNRLLPLFIGVTCLLLLAEPCAAQRTDTTRISAADTMRIDTSTSLVKKVPPSYHSPKKAALLSLIPGGGQVYNKKYWKVPVIYICYGGLAYGFNFNQQQYVTYRSALRNKLNGVPDSYSIYTESSLESAYQFYKNRRDLCVIGGVALYLLNIVDAAVDAHLYTFNVSDDLSLNIHPALISTASVNHPYTTGLGLSIHF